MSKQNDVQANDVVVEVYMAMQNAPEVYDFFISRSGNLKLNRLAEPMPKLIQVVMAGMHPTPAQQLRIASQFAQRQNFRILKFY